MISGAIATLGQFVLSVGDRQVVSPPLLKARAIAVYLISHRNTDVSRDRLVDLFYPHAEPKPGRDSLKTAISAIRHSLRAAGIEPDDVIAGAKTVVRWTLHMSVDHERFLELASATDDEAAREALSLYVGDFLEGDFSDWAIAERERFAMVYETLLSRLVARTRDIDLAQRLLQRNPYEELPYETLIEAELAAGRRVAAQSLARRAFAAFEELQTAPSSSFLTRFATLAAAPAAVRPAAPLPFLEPSPDLEARAARALLPFVGRDAETRTLADAWERAHAGRGSTVWLEGEPGIGKTRLTLQICRLAYATGARVLWGTTAPREVVPLQAVIEAVRPYVARATQLPVESIWLAALAPTFAELGSLAAGASELPPLEGAGGQERLFEGFAQVLCALAADRPLVLVLEDIQWAGSATLRAFEHFCARIKTSRILLIATSRSDEPGRTTAWRALRRRSRFETHAEHVVLPALTVHDVGSILDQLSRHERLNETALHGVSGGNPLFIEAGVRDAAESSQAYQYPGYAATVERRMQRLSSTAARVLHIASVVSDACDIDVLGAMSGLDQSSVIDACNELADRHFVRDAASTSASDYVFTHHLIASSVYERVPNRERTRLHRRAARYLERSFDEGDGSIAERVARHYASGGEAARAAPWYLRAALNAVAVFANDEALELATAGLDLVCGDAALEYDLVAIHETLRARRGQWEEARSDLARMESLARALDDPARRSAVLQRQIRNASGRGDRDAERALVAALHGFASDTAPDTTALAYECDAALQRTLGNIAETHRLASTADRLYAINGDVAGRVRALTLQSGASAYLGRISEAQRQLDEASRLAEEAGAYALRSRVINGAMTIAQLRYDYRLQHRLAAEALALAESAGDRVAEMEALQSMAVASWGLWNITDARRHFTAALRLGGELRSDAHLSVALGNFGCFEADCGDFEAAIASQEAAERHAARVGNELGEVVCADNLALYAEIAHNAAVARHHVIRGFDRAERLGVVRIRADFRARLGAIHMLEGDVRQGARYLDEAVAMRRAENNVTFLAVDLPMLGVARARSGELTKAVDAVDEATELFEQLPDDSEFRRAMWLAACTYRAADATRQATEVLTRAYEDFTRRRASLPSGLAAERFAAIPFNLAIRSAHEKGLWLQA